MSRSIITHATAHAHARTCSLSRGLVACRLFRIIRLFGRVKAIRQIINALSASLFPVFNAFVIMFIVMALFAIVGVFTFAEQDPAEVLDQTISTNVQSFHATRVLLVGGRESHRLFLAEHGRKDVITPSQSSTRAQIRSD